MPVGPQTMTSKILARAAGVDHVTPGDVVLAKIDVLTFLDGAASTDLITQHGLKVWDPTRILFCFDHFLQPEWFADAAVKAHPKIREFARNQGIPRENIYDLGRNGISHHIPVEQGWALPGQVCVGLDTQSATMGAANCFALPALYGADANLLTGDLWLIVPECVRINLSGNLPDGVNGKDVVYRLLTELGDHVAGKVIEFSGAGVGSLPIDVRLAIANGAAQIGALTIVFPADDGLLAYLKPRARHSFTPAIADMDAEYSASFDYDLATFERLIAGPHDINLVRRVNEVAGLDIDAAYIGSCSGGRLADLRLAADILRGRKVAPSVRLVVTPISADTAREAMAAGLLQIFLDAGATVTQPGCGACYSGNLSPLRLGDGDRCISTSVETVRGRMGSLESEVLLGNAAIVAASAIAGRIVDPGELLASLEERGQ